MSYLQLYFLILSHCLDIKSGFDIGLESWLQASKYSPFVHTTMT